MPRQFVTLIRYPTLCFAHRKLGPFVITVTLIITVVLLLIPRDLSDYRDGMSKTLTSPSESAGKRVSRLEPPHDWMHFWRFLIISANLLAVVVSLVVVYVHWFAKSFTTSAASKVAEMQAASDQSFTRKSKSGGSEKKAAKDSPQTSAQSNE